MLLKAIRFSFSAARNISSLNLGKLPNIWAIQPESYN